MTWTTVALIFIAWCLVSVVSGFAFAYFFGGMTRIHPDELAGHRAPHLEHGQDKASTRFPRRRVKPRARPANAYPPLAVGGVPDAPVEDR